MIEEHKYYTVRCDKCGKQYSVSNSGIKIFNLSDDKNNVLRFATKKIAKEVIETDGWKNMNGSFYCKDCLNK